MRVLASRCKRIENFKCADKCIAIILILIIIIIIINFTCEVTYCLFLHRFIQELLRAKQRVLEAASERGLLQAALARPTYPTGAQVTGPYPNTDNQYPVECGPLTKEQIEQVC